MRAVAYPTYLAATLSGASLRQLQYWRSQELLVPELRPASGNRVLYSFKDVVALRTFVYLREQESLQLIRQAIGTLRGLGNLEHLSQYTLVADGKRIVLVEPDAMTDLTNRPGQMVATYMRDVYAEFDNMQGARVVNLLKPRELVSVDPGLHGGYPVIAGTRVQYDLVASLIEDGVPAEEVVEFYPSVSADAARDAAAFARLVAEYRNGGVPSAA
jgi:uncharacterized protein (DUF433 family)/DNA-binding transcriptional MerR regulator